MSGVILTFTALCCVCCAVQVADLRDMIENSEALALDVTWNPTAGSYSARVWHGTEHVARGNGRCVAHQTDDAWLKQVHAVPC